MTHSARTRVVICGARVIGAAVAYYLSLRGVAATVIERCGVAYAASGKAGEFLALDWCDGSPLAALARKSFALHAELAQTLGVDYGYRRLTTLAVAAGAHGRPGTRQVPDELAWLDRHGLPYAVLGTLATTAQVHPARFTQALLHAARARGTALRLSCVEGLAVVHGQVRGVRVDGQLLPADMVVIAMGHGQAWSHRGCHSRRCGASKATASPCSPLPQFPPRPYSWTMSPRLVSASPLKCIHARTERSISAASPRRSHPLRLRRQRAPSLTGARSPRLRRRRGRSLTRPLPREP